MNIRKALGISNTVLAVAAFAFIFVVVCFFPNGPDALGIALNEFSRGDHEHGRKLVEFARDGGWSQMVLSLGFGIATLAIAAINSFLLKRGSLEK